MLKDNVPAKLALVLISCFVVWFLFTSFLWGALLFLAFLSVCAGFGSLLDGTNPTSYRGTRLMCWFFSVPILVEFADAGLGYLAGGTGTISGIQYAITCGLVASGFRELNSWVGRERGRTILEMIYEDKLKSTSWTHNESLWSIVRNRKTVTS